jgi:tripartite ATP-independent transporter DctP family solute receptor
MILRSALSAILLFLLCGNAAGLDLRSADVYAPEHPSVQAVAYMSTLIERRTSGRIKIASLGAKSISSEIFTIRAVQNGTLDLARVNLASLSTIVPAAIVPALPYIFRSTDHLRRVIDGPIGTELLSALDRHGLVGLCLYDNGARSFYGSKPIRTVHDMAGVKVRAPLSGPWISIFQTMGMRPTPMPYEQVPVGLRKGLVDLSENNWPAFVSSRHNEVAKYFSNTSHSMTPGVVIFSKRLWDGLSSEDQAIIRGAAQESVLHNRTLWNEHELTMVSMAKSLSVEIVSDVDRDSFARVIAPIYDRQIAVKGAEKLIMRIRSTK